MSYVYGTADPDSRRLGLDAAAAAVRRGELVVLPTDTAYGLGSDAFNPRGIASLLEAKGRGRDFPLPVLVGTPGTLDGLSYGVSTPARTLVEAFWPGALTVVEIGPNNETQGIGGYEAIEDGTYAAQIEAAQGPKIDGIAGATITSDAVKTAVQRALEQGASR